MRFILWLYVGSSNVNINRVRLVFENTLNHVQCQSFVAVKLCWTCLVTQDLLKSNSHSAVLEWCLVRTHICWNQNAKSPDGNAQKKLSACAVREVAKETFLWVCATKEKYGSKGRNARDDIDAQKRMWIHDLMSIQISFYCIKPLFCFMDWKSHEKQML